MADSPSGRGHPAPDAALAGLVVADLSSGIAGGYATKLLADAGATVVKLEPPEGDLLRAWSASHTPRPPGTDQPLFRYLAGGKQSVVLDPDHATTVAAARSVLARSDAVVWSPESRLAALPQLSPEQIVESFPQLDVVSLTPFGRTGPWADRPATEFTLQAWSGGVFGLGRGAPDRAPFQIGGQVGEWLSGTYAAIALLAMRRRSGLGGVVDLSKLEVDALTMTYYPVTFVDVLGRPMRKGRATIPPGIMEAKDGLIGMVCGTLQQRADLYAMVGRPEWSDDPLISRPDEVVPVIAAWVAERTVEEVRDLATAFRIPSAPVGNGASIPEWEVIRQRDSLVRSADGRFVQPRVPYRSSSADLAEPSVAPSLGEHTEQWLTGDAGAAAADHGARAGSAPARPLEGLRVLDMTAYWAGPMCTHTLALLGAEVIHLESAKRPDGGRLVGGVPGDLESWWERSPIHLGSNVGKLDVTIDFGTEEGRELLLELVATCDVVVENFTPRVLDSARLDFAALQARRPDLIMVRMPGFGLDGPWRDSAAFAYAIEDAAGLSWLTGYADRSPAEPGCVGDPIAGLHAAYAILTALARRDRGGAGCQLEVAMIDAALNVAAEQIIEFSANGVLLNRDGNRGPAAAPQNLYQAEGVDENGKDDVWVALAVVDDAQWDALCDVVDDSALRDARFATSTGRREHHDAIDAILAPWFRKRAADDAVEALWAAGVPVARATLPHRQVDLDQLRWRRFHEEVQHPVAGTYRQGVLPFRWPGGPERMIDRRAPLLGEHNEEVLGRIGVGSEALARLAERRVIGTTLSS